jgi:hypothetical protein
LTRAEEARQHFNKKTAQKRRDLHPQKFNAFNSEQREKVVESKTPGCYHYRREKEEEEEVSVKQSHNGQIQHHVCDYSHVRERRKEREEKKENRHRENRLNNKNDAPTISDASMGRTSSLPTLIFDFQR